MDRPPTPPLDLARMWSPRVRATIGVLVVAYIVELAFSGALEPILSLRGLGAGFQPWQPLTYTLIQGEPVSAVFGWVGVFFFMDMAHAGMGARRFWVSTFITWALATFGSLMIGLTGLLQATYVFGPWWWLDAMLVWFAFKNRDAQVRWMMVLPMKAEVIAWLVLLLSVLRLAYYRDVASAHLVFAWFAAWATVWIDGDTWRRWKLLRRKKAIEKELSKFQVLDGGRGQERPRRQKPDDWAN
ncbi:hypothetical protein LBMAG42_37110 [Deltaproteobacteria bacterium]|nr:hypothetical protein LBMAG42_37110 [Deltaproteobacteria bacterium]